MSDIKGEVLPEAEIISFIAPQVVCSFCKKPKAEAKQFFNGNNGAFICGDCVVLCKQRITA